MRAVVKIRDRNTLMKFGGVVPPLNDGPPSDILRLDHPSCPHCGSGCAGDRCDESMLMKSDELSSDKAQKILHDGTVHGNPITDRQRRFMGWVAGGRKQPLKKSKRAASRDEYADDRPAHIDRDVETSDFKSPGTVRAHSRTAPGGNPVFVSMYSRNFRVAPHHADTVRQHFAKIQQAHESGDEGFHFEHDYDDADKGKVPLHVLGNYDGDADKPTNVLALHRDNGTIFQPHPDDKDFHGEIAQAASDEYHGVSGYKRNTAMKSHDHAAVGGDQRHGVAMGRAALRGRYRVTVSPYTHETAKPGQHKLKVERVGDEGTFFHAATVHRSANEAWNHAEKHFGPLRHGIDKSVATSQHSAAARYHGRLAKALREHGEIDLMNEELAKARRENRLARHDPHAHTLMSNP